MRRSIVLSGSPDRCGPGGGAMRPGPHQRYTVTGRAGIYTVPSVAAVDARMRVLLAMLRDATPSVAGRICHDLDLLLDHRLVLMQERP